MFIRLAKTFLVLLSFLGIIIFLSSGCSSTRTGVNPAILSYAVKITHPKFYPSSGVVVRSNDMGTWIVTNRHVCEVHLSASDVTVITTTTKMKGQIINLSSTNDLCMIYSTYKNHVAAKLANQDVKWGDYIESVGNPLTKIDMPITGVAANLEGGYGNKFRKMRMDTHPGQSGSGVYNSSGELVGIATYMQPGAPTLAGMVAFSYLKEFIKESTEFSKALTNSLSNSNPNSIDGLGEIHSPDIVQ